MTKDYVIGIDLGTTTTEAAIFRNGKTEMIINLNHEIVTPSAVGIDESGNFIIGAKAKAQYLLAPERTARLSSFAEGLTRLFEKKELLPKEERE